jgi:hypothetical protein
LDRTLQFFNDYSLTQQDLIFFVETLNKFQNTFGPIPCWRLKSAIKSQLPGFNTSHPRYPTFKKVSAKPLALAVVDQYEDETNSILVTRHQCRSTHCINPNHCYWGTKRDVCFERGWRKKSQVTPELVAELRNKYESEKISFASLSKTYKLPYHIVRNICRYVVYD